MSGEYGRLRCGRLGRVMVAGLLVMACGASPWEAARSAAPPPARAHPPRSPWNADGGAPRHLEPPPIVSPRVTAVDRPDVAARPPSVLGIPGTVLDAYRRAAGRERACHLPWQLLAAIGKVESNHADDGAVDAAGTATTPILGPALDGTGGYAAIPNTGPGQDGGSPWARAVGPMQFIPSTWARWGTDGNGDGRADPQNVYDAAAAAAAYLCANGRDLSTPDGLASAVLSYNHSARYLDVVSRWYAAYSSGDTVAVPDNPGAPPVVNVAAVLPPPAAKPALPTTPPASPPPPPPSAPQPPLPAPAPTPAPPLQPDPVTALVTGVVGTVTGILGVPKGPKEVSAYPR